MSAEQYGLSASRLLRRKLGYLQYELVHRAMELYNAMSYLYGSSYK